MRHPVDIDSTIYLKTQLGVQLSRRLFCSVSMAGSGIIYSIPNLVRFELTEELEQVNESAFARLMASSIDESSAVTNERNGSEIPARPDLFKISPGKAQEAAEGQRKDNGELPGHTKFLSEKGKVQDSTTGQPEEAEDGEGESSSAMPAINW
ncbi:hypothetical protein V8E54_000640 [Elaphomyces granulatus]